MTSPVYRSRCELVDGKVSKGCYAVACTKEKRTSDEMLALFPEWRTHRDAYLRRIDSLLSTALRMEDGNKKGGKSRGGGTTAAAQARKQKIHAIAKELKVANKPRRQWATLLEKRLAGTEHAMTARSIRDHLKNLGL